MSEENKTRFRSAEEALRFYFRLRELLHSGRTRRLVPNELPADACTIAANALDDYRCIGWCMRGLDDLALWLLGEIYGPTCFGVRRWTFSHACKAGRLEFPDREFRLREVRMIHERALGVVKRGLRKLGMVPGRRVKTAREGRPLRTVRKRAHLHGARRRIADEVRASSPIAEPRGVFRAVKIPVRLRATGMPANGIDEAERERKSGE